MLLQKLQEIYMDNIKTQQDYFNILDFHPQQITYFWEIMLIVVTNQQKIYGFYQECRERYSITLYKKFKQLFDVLPIASCIEDKIFCVHGGISPQLENAQQLRNIIRPTSIPDQGLLCDLLWADPEKDIDGFQENDRGVSYVFGARQVEQMLRKFQCDLIVRAHQVVDNGYEFFAQRRLVTVFSAPCYCNTYNNAGAIMNVDQSLMCSFQVLIGENQQRSQYQQVE